MRLTILGAFLVLGLGPAPAAGQNVVVVRGVPETWAGSAEAADFDGDGDADLMVIGQTLDGEPVTGLYAFTGRLEEPLPLQAPRIVAVYEHFSFAARQMNSGNVTWADVDGDGDMDLLMTGTGVDEVDIDNIVELPATDLFENAGQRTMIIRNSGLPALQSSVAAWADIDSDGDLDLAIGGSALDGSPFLGVFRHNGAFGFSLVPTGLPQIIPTDVAWGDFDGDGDLDLFSPGTGIDGAVNVLAQNDGAGGFTLIESGIPAWLFSSARAADFDADGDADLFLTGGVLSPDLVSGVSALYRSDGGRFVAVDQEFSATFSGQVRWGDFDGDGDEDLLVAGIQDLEESDHQRIVVYEQVGGVFSKRFDLRGALFGTTTWYDYDGNGRLDILMSGIQDGRLIMTIFEL
ncbi:MAG: hypothetical protein ACI80V_001124 [Rhodothermales bacterium]|jgi:hypothetical protein